MLIEVTEIHPVKPGGKVARLVAADGIRYEIWPEKLEGVTPGKRYEVEITERQYNGRTFKSVAKITPAREEVVPNGNTQASPKGTDSSPRSATGGEAEYVGRVLAA